jgi:adenosylmethionine-8-amino-7-oxononanoate aminotransferase
LSAIETEFVDPHDAERVGEIVEGRACHFLRPLARGSAIVLEPVQFTRVFACLIEPIQGEGGIRPMPAETLQWLADHHKVIGLPLIVDEIQTGCGRTGSFLLVLVLGFESGEAVSLISLISVESRTCGPV